MSQTTQIICDECGAVKKEANHWWAAGVSIQAGFFLCPIDGVGAANIALAVSTQEMVGFDLCSEDCVQRTVSKYLRGEFKA